MESIAKKNVNHLTPFDPGPSDEELMDQYGLSSMTRLSMNENVYGCSPRVLEALQAIDMETLTHYPSARTNGLRHVLAQKHGVDPENIVMTNGLDEMLLLLARTFIDVGDEILAHIPTFPESYRQAEVDGAVPVLVPDQGTALDWKGMKENLSSKTKYIYLCNPNNPTGRLLSLEEISAFLDEVPDHLLVLVDEAYIEFSDEEESISAINLMDQYPQVAVMRTFSKAYGLANARIGYAIFSPQHIQAIDSVRLPFNFNTLNEKMAIAALNDQDFLKEVRQLNQAEKVRWMEFFDTHGLNYHPSATNFIFVHVPNSEKLIQQALEQGYRLIAHSYEDYIRLTLPQAADGVILRELFKQHLMQ